MSAMNNNPYMVLLKWNTLIAVVVLIQDSIGSSARANLAAD